MLKAEIGMTLFGMFLEIFPVNFLLLKNALFQMGPYKNIDVPFSEGWLHTELINKISSINWGKTKEDVEKFLSANDSRFLQSWSKDFFLSQIGKVHLLLKNTVIFRIANGKPPELSDVLFSSAITDLTGVDVQKNY